MKVVVTGHSRGIGKAIYEYFKDNGHEVIGLSTQNGYDIVDRYEEALKIARTADVFVNNVWDKHKQLQFLKDLLGEVDKIIVCGSRAGDLIDHVSKKREYIESKNLLKQECFKQSFYYPNSILHLNISQCENAVKQDPGTYYIDIVNAIDFWLKNPRVFNIEFSQPLTEYIDNAVEWEFGKKLSDILS